MNLAMFSTKALVFLLVFVLPPAGRQVGPSDKPQVYGDPDGYAVLSKLLDAQRHGSENLALEIASPTVSAKEMWHHLDDCVQVPDEFRGAAKDFNEKATTRLDLEDRFQLSVKHTIVKARPVTPSDYAKLRAAGSANPQQSTSSLFYVSAVGFDTDKTHAIAYVNVVCGFNCCGGTFHLLKKGSHGWEELKDVIKCQWMC